MSVSLSQLVYVPLTKKELELARKYGEEIRIQTANEKTIRVGNKYCCGIMIVAVLKMFPTWSIHNLAQMELITPEKEIIRLCSKQRFSATRVEFEASVTAGNLKSCNGKTLMFGSIEFNDDWKVNGFPVHDDAEYTNQDNVRAIVCGEMSGADYDNLNSPLEVGDVSGSNSHVCSGACGNLKYADLNPLRSRAV